MKIGLVCPYNVFRGGGVQECILALQEGLSQLGHETYIITPQPLDHNGEAPDGIIFIGKARAFRAVRTLGDISITVDTKQLEQVLLEENFDLLHFHEPWVPWISVQIMQRSDVVHIATFHAAMSERKSSKAVEKVITPYTKSIFNYLDSLTAVSETATNYARSLTDRPRKIIPNGIDLKKYSPPKEYPDNQQKTILYIGRLEKRKGVKYLIKAFKILVEQNPEYRLLIAGDGPENEKLHSLVEYEEIPNVEFLGYIKTEVKHDLLQKADLFCSPAMYGESFGIVLLEAMASGCVTVSGNNPGYEGVLNGFGQISIVNPEDSKEFARRLKLLSSNQTLRSEWRKWALNEVKKYDYSKVVKQYLDLYEETLVNHD